MPGSISFTVKRRMLVISPTGSVPVGREGKRDSSLAVKEQKNTRACWALEERFVAYSMQSNTTENNK